MPELKKILYVEDEPDIQVVAKMALEMLGGFEVKSCSSGAEALQAVESFTPDLFLLDVMMPEMDGPSLLKALRSIPSVSKVPIVFMTAKVRAQEVSYYHSIGAVGVIAKPFDAINLVGEITRIWNDRAVTR